MKVSEDVLGVLGRMTFDGNNAILPPGQLERSLYTATDKVLKACGGTWNRHAKAHVFAEPAADLVEAVLFTGEVQTSSDIGFFPTPAPLAAELVAMAGIGPVPRANLRVLEPSAGTGRIVEALTAAGIDTVVCIERDKKMRAELARIRGAWWTDCDDFMDYEPRYGNGTIKRYDYIVMNPPFGKVGKGDHLDHVRHAHHLLAHDGVLISVLPSGVKFREDKRHVAFREWIESEGGEIIDLPDGSFKESGTGVSTVVVRFDNSDQDRAVGDPVIKESGKAATCGYCDRGFRRVDGIHIPSQRLGMIPEAPCERVCAVHDDGAALYSINPWTAYVDGEPLRSKKGDARRFKTAKAAYRAACKGAPRRWHE